MKFYKVTSLQLFGQYDYKGLDIDKFIPGSQVYNDIDNEFSVATTEVLFQGHPDVAEITEAEYTTYRDRVIPKPIMPEEAEALNTRLDTAETDLGLLLLECTNDKATISSLEETVGNLLLEVAALKGGTE
ncbi:hypothetical protein [Paenibacillus lautus]|uniref:hypothetical protein n=1 Tax=Paenibacillus lautus TaxID=1401 RepID=UPI003987AE45